MRKNPKPRSCNKDDVAIGKRIRQRRNELKISQEKLGDALGITFQQIQKYEKGTNRVVAGRLVQIARALDCDVTFFLPAESRKADSDVDTVMASKDGVMIAKALVRIADDNVRHMIARFVDDLSRMRRVALQPAE